ncbi:hypothetical protein NDU88_001116 [Pleurodeles waltl]|uniref:Uncharacterized protein n=1 Tax=Pleurodeles waltl TaxID=8319 RepID=A0AAV7VZ96_PLEWA|nr:hypothetical protein NDU88_001116 [Pleurodeles waltl]
MALTDVSAGPADTSVRAMFLDLKSSLTNIDAKLEGPLLSSVPRLSLVTTELPSAPIHEQPLRYFFHLAGRSRALRLSSPAEQRPPHQPSFMRTSTPRSGEPGLPPSLTPPSKPSTREPRLHALRTPGEDNPPAAVPVRHGRLRTEMRTAVAAQAGPQQPPHQPGPGP